MKISKTDVCIVNTFYFILTVNTIENHNIFILQINIIYTIMYTHKIFFAAYLCLKILNSCQF